MLSCLQRPWLLDLHLVFRSETGLQANGFVQGYRWQSVADLTFDSALPVAQLLKDQAVLAGLLDQPKLAPD